MLKDLDKSGKRKEAEESWKKLAPDAPYSDRQWTFPLKESLNEGIADDKPLADNIYTEYFKDEKIEFTAQKIAFDLREEGAKIAASYIKQLMDEYYPDVKIKLKK
jgi:hypothetical protein